MKTIQTIVITGYRSFELSVFQEKDPKIKVIKKVIKMAVQQYLEDGLEWVLIGGNLGVEIWAGQVVLELQKDYPELKLALIVPFSDFGNQWNEKNQQILNDLKVQANYVNSTSHLAYNNPSQLKNHTFFLLEHSAGALLVYDEEYTGKTQFFYRDAREYATKNNYFLQLISMDDLQNTDFTDDSV